MRVLARFQTRCVDRLAFVARAAGAGTRQRGYARLAPLITAMTGIAPSPSDAVAVREAIPITTLIRDWYGIRERVEPVPDQRNGATVSAPLMRLVVIGAFGAYLLVVAGLGEHFTGPGHAAAEPLSSQSKVESFVSGQLRMGPVSTGFPEVDNAVRGFLAGDVGVANSQLLVQQVPCGTLPSGGAPFLHCVAPEPRGTVHELVLSTCPPKWVTAEAANAELASALADTPGLYAVDRLSNSYTAVLSWPDALDRSLVLTISAAGVTSYGTTCGLPLDPSPDREMQFVTGAGG